jgi:hypothetical protein
MQLHGSPQDILFWPVLLVKVASVEFLAAAFQALSPASSDIA